MLDHTIWCREPMAAERGSYVTGPRKTTLTLLIFFHNMQLESLLYTCAKFLGLKTRPSLKTATKNVARSQN